MSLSLSLAREPTDVDFDIRLCRTGAKTICVNGKPIRKLADLVGIMNIVIFSPEDMSLVKEGPGQRRKFLDSLLSQIKPRYFHDLQQYVKILGQRNSLLKEIRNDPSLAATLDIWSEPLAEYVAIDANYEFVGGYANWPLVRRLEVPAYVNRFLSDPGYELISDGCVRS